MSEHDDVIVIVGGPGGASLAQPLAPFGRGTLIHERGDYLLREEANRSPKAVFVEGRYQAISIGRKSRGTQSHSRRGDPA